MGTKPDIRVEPRGHLVLLRPDTEYGRAWLAQNARDAVSWYGDAAAIDPRTVNAVLQSAESDSVIVLH